MKLHTVSAGLKNPIVCVDPSKEMLELVKQHEGVSPILSSAKEYFLNNPSPPDVPYNKITLHSSFQRRSYRSVFWSQELSS